MNLDRIIAARSSEPPVRVVDGVMVTDANGNLAVNIAGTHHVVPMVGRWTLAPGQPVQVLIAGMHMQILGPITTTRPARGIVVACDAGSPTLTVETTLGKLTCERLASYTPMVGNEVVLSWQQDPPIVLGTVTIAQVDPGPSPIGPAPPPGGPTSGTKNIAAIDSGSWTNSGGWNNTQRSNVMQGTWKGLTCQGIWLYGAAPSELRGRTITGCRVRIGPRRHVGSYNAPLGFSVIIHPHDTRPGGQLTVLGTQMSQGFPDGHTDWVELPPGWGQTIVNNGGGLGLVGGAYGGSAGIKDGNPESGMLQLDWRT